MGIAKTSNAAACMNILTLSRHEEGEDDNFASVLKQILSRGGFIRETSTGDLFGTVKREEYVPKTTFTEYVRSPYSESTYWRKEMDYDAFLNYFQNSKVEYTDDMWDIDTTGQRSINVKGEEHFSQWRMDRLQSLTPGSVEDAEQRFEASWEHLNNYMHTMFEDFGIEYEFNYQPQAVPGASTTGLLYGTNKLGMPDYEGNAQRLRDFLKSKPGQKMEAMIEEVQFYGAIAKFASTNPDFNEAYNQDSKAALTNYASNISATMNTIKLPKVQTVPNLYRQLVF